MSAITGHSRRVAIIAAAVIVVGVGVWAYLSIGNAVPAPADKADAARRVSVEASAVHVGVVTVEAEIVGSLLANESVTIRPEITGRVDAIHFQEGQFVTKGMTLISLDTKELRAQLAQSAAAANLARLNYARMKDLVDRNIVSRQAYDEAKARLDDAEAKVQLDQARLAKATLRAPFAGLLGVRRVSPGDYVAPGQDIVNLESVDPIKVELRLPETYANQIASGQVVRLRVDAFPGEEYKGEIYVIDPRVDVTTRTLLARARAPNRESKLRPGMFVSATVELTRREQAVLVPEQALVPSGTEQFVYRVVDGKAARTKVSVGVRRAGEAEILTGVQPEDIVVTAGHQKLRDGSPVSVERGDNLGVAQPAAPVVKTP